MIGQAVLGIVAGLAIGAVISWRRRRACHGGGRWFRLARRLELDQEQRGELYELMRELRQAARPLRRDGLRAAVEAVAAPQFDRTRIEQAAGALRSRLVEALERAHEILRPEQRARLAELVGGFGFDGGPYRS
jgi:Spy/CpxP family protein refolding chaperone